MYYRCTGVDGNRLYLNMRRLLFLLLLLPLIGVGQHAQLGVGFLGHFGYQPGIEVSYEHGLTNWEKTTSKDQTRASDLYLGGNVGWFSRIGYNTNFRIGPELGLFVRKQDKRFFSNYSLSMNYLMQAEALSKTVNLKGKVTGVTREYRHYMMPLIGYGFGQLFDNGLGWQFSLSGGMRVSSRFESSGMLFTALTLRYQFNEE